MRGRDRGQPRQARLNLGKSGEMDNIRLGPTKKFPRGKIHESDEGETQIAIGHSEGNVILHFGAPTSWVGFPPDKALALAKAIQEHAHAAQGGRTQ